MPTLRFASAAQPLPCDDSLVIAGSILPQHLQGEVAPLRATCALIDADVAVCFVSCDVIAVPGHLADRAAKRIEEECGVPLDNVLIAGTHTHHAPSTIRVHGYEAEERFCRGLEDAIVAAAQAGRQELDEAEPGSNEIEAEIGFAFSQEATVGGNSRKLLKDGCLTWRTHGEDEIVRPTGPFDPDLPLIAFRRPGGELAGGLFNHSTHSIGPCGRGRSPAFYGLAARELEAEIGGQWLFLPGAFGSTHSQVLPDVEAKARIGSALREGIDDLRFGLSGPVQCLRRRFEYTVRRFDETAEEEAVRTYCQRYVPPETSAKYLEVFRAMRRELAPVQGETRQTWLQVIRLGEIVLVGIPGELFASLGLAIRRRSPFRHTVVVGLANDWIGYLPDRETMALGGYQCWTGLHSFVAEGTGEALVEEAVRMLEEAAGASAPADGAGDLVLREVQPGDAPGLQRFYNTLCPYSRMMFRPLGWNATRSQCEQVVGAAQAGERYDIVAVAGNRLVGWAFLVHLREAVPHLGIGCADDFLGKGLGKRLMQAVMDKARAEGKRGVDLIVVRQNERAWRLYEQYGFRRTKELSRPDGQNYYSMLCEL